MTITTDTMGTGTAERCVIVMPASELGAKLHDASLFAGTDRARPILNAVCVERSEDETVFVATDSHILGVVTVDGDGATGSWLLDLDTAKLWAKTLLGIKYGDAALTFGDGEATLTVPGGEFTARLVDGDYPNWRSLWDQSVEPAQADDMGWNRKYLGTFSKIKSDKSSAVRFTSYGPKPALWSIGTDLRGLLMPMRIR